MTTGVWIPTTDATPPRFTQVLLWMRKGWMGDGEELAVAWEDWYEVTEDAGNFTHWMIPGAPQEETK